MGSKWIDSAKVTTRADREVAEVQAANDALDVEMSALERGSFRMLREAILNPSIDNIKRVRDLDASIKAKRIKKKK